MRALACAIGASTFIVFSTVIGHAADPYDQPLSLDKQIVHVLNRLTFGPRPGDLEQVRAVGVERWIDRQLHPERIAENPALAAKLEPLRTLQMAMWQILQQYPQVPAALNIRPASSRAFALLPQPQASKLLYCSVEERQATLAALDPDTRRLVLTAAPPQVLEGLPEDLREEANLARRAEQDERRQQVRRMMPPLNELLSVPEIRIATQGSADEKLALLNSLDDEKRRLVVRALPPRAVEDFPELRRESMAARQPAQFVHDELVAHKLYRALYSHRQLEEVLVDFWMNHFNVYNGKGPERQLLTSFERDAIRPHVFGRFHDMLLATARHPAMLYYLDNWQSQSPREDIPYPPGARRPGLNENYGRELLELHTLGVDGGYTQDDVVAVARAFTGWTIYDTQKFAEFHFNPAMHDRKEKVVLGHVLPAMAGEQDGLRVVDILAHHSSTARFISKKLAQRFVADDPPRALVDRMAATFTKTGGDLREVLRTLLASPEFMSDGAWQAKLKSPLEMAVSALRATHAEVTDTFALARRIADLGQPLYGKPEPTGYPNTGDAWANTAGVLGRINVATAIAAGQVPGVRVDIRRFDSTTPAAVAREILGVSASASMLAAVEHGVKAGDATLLAALIIGSPDFQRR